MFEVRELPERLANSYEHCLYLGYKSLYNVFFCTQTRILTLDWGTSFSDGSRRRNYDIMVSRNPDGRWYPTPASMREVSNATFRSTVNEAIALMNDDPGRYADDDNVGDSLERLKGVSYA